MATSVAEAPTAAEEEDLAALRRRGPVSDATHATAAWNASAAMVSRTPLAMGLNVRSPELAATVC